MYYKDLYFEDVKVAESECEDGILEIEATVLLTIVNDNREKEKVEATAYFDYDIDERYMVGPGSHSREATLDASEKEQKIRYFFDEALDYIYEDVGRQALLIYKEDLAS